MNSNVNQGLQTVTIQKSGIFLTCQRCKNNWLYCGASKFMARCSRCHTSVSIVKQQKSQGVLDRSK